ncbi:hypothetical protein HC891_25830, partial [Candidatus Gracilibacteria bacterium]|nr:hypothetical protein [Candidatus Gracilibacteria bacterium]
MATEQGRRAAHEQSRAATNRVTQATQRRERTFALPLALTLVLLALLPRTFGLADFLTTDEAYHWIERTERFSDAVSTGQWHATIQTGHPGVTLMWLGSLGLAIERWAFA